LTSPTTTATASAPTSTATATSNTGGETMDPAAVLPERPCAGDASGLLQLVEQPGRAWFGRALLNPDWINGLAASVLGAALVFSWLERASRLRRRLPRPVATALATALGVLSLGVYVAFGDVQFPYHRWDQFGRRAGRRAAQMAGGRDGRIPASCVLLGRAPDLN
jgi:hypothetical protein